jgi:hypothetical protein
MNTPEVTTVVEVIDVELAKTLLALNRPHKVGVEGTNRGVRPAQIHKFAQAMLAGEWELTNQGIGISSDDELIDGQHRLLAVLLAAETNPDISIQSNVTWNLSPSSKLAVDIGGTRRPGDFLAMQGIGNGNKVGAALKLLECYYDRPYEYTAWTRHSITPSHLMTLLSRFREVEDAYNLGRGVMRVTSPSSITAALTIVLRDRPELVEHLPRFLEPLKTGANVGIGSPILALRTWCGNASLSKKKSNGVMLLALIIRSLNHWVEDTRARHLVFREADGFPAMTKKEFYPR